VDLLSIQGSVDTTPLLSLPSPIEPLSFEGRSLFLKRDELIHPHFSGNKARKFHYFLTHQFEGITTLISYGSAQSNAMYSLSVLAKIRGWRFCYFVEHLATFLEQNPHGNYHGALVNGMELCIGKPPQSIDNHTLMIEEGGRQAESEWGLRVLAQEIEEWRVAQGFESLTIFLPSGTGTTALFLQKALNHLAKGRSRVYTTPCVGDRAYLTAQFTMLCRDTHHHPTILSLDKKHHFAKLYKENYKIWLKLQQQTGVEFDLLYDPLGWRTLLAHSELFSTQTPILYLHQGGVLGNESMLPRYQRKYKDLA